MSCPKESYVMCDLPTTPAGQVEVHTVQAEPLATTGGGRAEGLAYIGLAVALLIAGAVLTARELKR